MVAKQVDKPCSKKMWSNLSLLWNGSESDKKTTLCSQMTHGLVYDSMRLHTCRGLHLTWLAIGFCHSRLGQYSITLSYVDLIHLGYNSIRLHSRESTDPCVWFGVSLCTQMLDWLQCIMYIYVTINGKRGFAWVKFSKWDFCCLHSLCLYTAGNVHSRLRTSLQLYYKSFYF